MPLLFPKSLFPKSGPRPTSSYAGKLGDTLNPDSYLKQAGVVSARLPSPVSNSLSLKLLEFAQVPKQSVVKTAPQKQGLPDLLGWFPEDSLALPLPVQSSDTAGRINRKTKGCS